jgi:hypothetical protein
MCTYLINLFYAIQNRRLREARRGGYTHRVQKSESQISPLISAMLLYILVHHYYEKHGEGYEGSTDGSTSERHKI